MFRFDYVLHNLFQLFEVRLTGYLVIRQREVIEETIVRGWTNRELSIFVVQLNCVAKKVRGRVPESFLIECDALNLTRFFQWLVIQVQKYGWTLYNLS